MAKKTHAIFVLDRSGSMNSCRQATIEGFNEQLNALAAGGDKVFVSCVQFDNPQDIDTLYQRIKVADAPRLSEETFVPRGMTAMLDAVGKAIALADADKKSDSLLIIVVSDGGENSSLTENYGSIAEKIGERTSKGNWTFAYIGANQDLSVISQRMNIPIGNTMTYSANPAGTRSMYAATSSVVLDFAGGIETASASLFSGIDQGKEDISGKVIRRAPRAKKMPVVTT